MAEFLDSELNGVVQEHPFTTSESLTTDSHSDAVFKKPNCTVFEKEEEINDSLKDRILEKPQKGVYEVSEMEKKKEESLDFCCEDEEGSVKCALKIEVIDETALIGAANLSDISKKNWSNNKRIMIQESDKNGKRIVGSNGNLGWNGNYRGNLMQECDENGKRIMGFDGNPQSSSNEKSYVMQEVDGNGRGLVNFNRNLQNNGNEKGYVIQESGGNGERNIGVEESVKKNGNNDKRDVNVNQESEGKKEKRPRRRGKKNDWKSRGDEKEKMLTFSSDDAVNIQALKVCREGMVCYSRKEMEELRFVDVEEQKKKWVEVYCGLGPEITEEYNGLVDSDNQKGRNISLDFDPRHQFGYRRAPSVSGDSCSKNADNETKSVNSLDPDITLPIDDEYGYQIAEEERSDDDGSEEDYESILKPAFLVKGEPDFDSGPPQDGLEYLRRVRWEASRIPKVKVSKVDKTKLNREQTTYMPQIPEIAKCPEHLLPLKQWEDAFLADFSELRLALSRYEDSTDKFPGKQPAGSLEGQRESTPVSSGTIIVDSFEDSTAGEDSFGYSDVSADDSSNNQQTVPAICEGDASDTRESPNHKQSTKEALATYPTLSVILKMEPVARVSMLRKRISSLENAKSSISKDDCLWLFALSAAVDTPLDADTCASFRSLLRKCASLRAQKVDLDDEVVMVNILATIAGRYFGQSEN